MPEVYRKALGLDTSSTPVYVYDKKPIGCARLMLFIGHLHPSTDPTVLAIAVTTANIVTTETTETIEITVTTATIEILFPSRVSLPTATILVPKHLYLRVMSQSISLLRRPRPPLLNFFVAAVSSLIGPGNKP
jgi:hypothetical protein